MPCATMMGAPLEFRFTTTLTALISPAPCDIRNLPLRTSQRPLFPELLWLPNVPPAPLE